MLAVVFCSFCLFLGFPLRLLSDEPHARGFAVVRDAAYALVMVGGAFGWLSIARAGAALYKYGC